MSPVSRPVVPGTWVRRLSQAADHRYTSDGNSSSYSSADDTHRQYVSSYVVNDDLNDRSYVDPWDMENYSFLRQQFEDFSLSDNELSPAAAETTQSDFYYVPLDNNGSPQYQYKRYVDVNKGGVSPQSLRSDGYGLMANIDEYDFYNDHLDHSNLSLLQFDDASLGFNNNNNNSSSNNNNPSRQSERSRFNNQDYQTYTPPSIIKDISCKSGQLCKLKRRASVSFRPDLTCTSDPAGHGWLPGCHFKEPSDQFYQLEGRKSLADVKIKLNRRKSFHDLSSQPAVKFGKQERRKSVLDRPEKWQSANGVSKLEVLPENRAKENSDLARETARKKSLEKGILLGPENKCNRAGLNVSFNNEVLQSTSNGHVDSSLVYAYETAARKSKMFLPKTSSKIYDRNSSRYDRSKIHDAFSCDPIEQYLNRPISRYTMTNYGHLKIDYSCSWNYLDQCMAQRICL